MSRVDFRIEYLEKKKRDYTLPHEPQGKKRRSEHKMSLNGDTIGSRVRFSRAATRMSSDETTGAPKLRTVGCFFPVYTDSMSDDGISTDSLSDSESSSSDTETSSVSAEEALPLSTEIENVLYSRIAHYVPFDLNKARARIDSVVERFKNRLFWWYVSFDRFNERYKNHIIFGSIVVAATCFALEVYLHGRVVCIPIPWLEDLTPNLVHDEL